MSEIKTVMGGESEEINEGRRWVELRRVWTRRKKGSTEMEEEGGGGGRLNGTRLT